MEGSFCLTRKAPGKAINRLQGIDGARIRGLWIAERVHLIGGLRCAGSPHDS
jgi:hypothetical protein